MEAKTRVIAGIAAPGIALLAREAFRRRHFSSRSLGSTSPHEQGRDQMNLHRIGLG